MDTAGSSQGIQFRKRNFWKRATSVEISIVSSTAESLEPTHQEEYHNCPKNTDVINFYYRREDLASFR